MTTADDVVRCVICGGEDTRPVTSAVGRRRYCMACFHGWRPTAPDFAYEAVAMCPLGTGDARLAAQIDFLSPYVPRDARVLEIGCATGELAAAARGRLGIACYEAIELSPAAIQAESRVDRLHRKPLRDLLRAGDIEAGFDVVIISHVLEHLEDPAAEIASIGGVLKPGGALFIEAPNRSGNTVLPIDDNKSHIHFFSTSSLARLLSAQGLEIVATATGARLDARYADSLRVVARPFETPGWSATLLSDRLALAENEQIVVWGAGSLADEVLANFFDVARIAFFIDRNPTKKGAWRLGLPVCGPEALDRGPRTVLINSIDFAEAIAADIAKRPPRADRRIVRIGDLLEDEGRPWSKR